MNQERTKSRALRNSSHTLFCCLCFKESDPTRCRLINIKIHFRPNNRKCFIIRLRVCLTNLSVLVIIWHRLTWWCFNSCWFVSVHTYWHCQIHNNHLHISFMSVSWLWVYYSWWCVGDVSVKWEGNVRSTYHIIDMPLFAFPAYLKSLKDMRKPGGPQERNTWEVWEKTNIAPQTVGGVKWNSPLANKLNLKPI